MSTAANEPGRKAKRQPASPVGLSHRPGAASVSAARKDSQIPSTPTPPVRWKLCLGIATPLIVANCGWIANSEMRTNVTEGTISTLFMGVTFILFVVVLLNFLARRLLDSKRALNHPELMALYTLLSVSSVVAGVGHYEFLMPSLANFFHYDTPANGWRQLWYLLPWYVGPRNPAVLRGFYEGRTTVFQHNVLLAWAGPLIVWSTVFLVLFWTSLCLATIVRRRWQEDEHLPFPVIALPLEMTRPDGLLFRQRLLWAGFAIPLCLHSLNSLASIIPGLPSFPINSEHDFVSLAQLPLPWTGMDTVHYMLHPVGVGFGFLVSTDVSFSLWFFYLLKKVLGVWGVAQGWRTPGMGWYGDEAAQFPLTMYQGWGAWLAFGLITLWSGRTYLLGFVKRAFRGDPHGEDRDEPMTARQAVFGFLGGYLALCCFVWSTGGSWWLPIVFFGIYIVLMVALSRLRAETAVICTELTWVNPQSIIPAFVGTGSMGSHDLGHLGMMTWFNSDYRAAEMPHAVEGLVGMRRSGGRLKPLIVAMLIACVVAMIAASLWDLQLYYTLGADSAKVNQWRVGSKGSEGWNNLANWIHNPKGYDPKVFLGMTIGVVMTLLLSALRMRFVGFPFHPAGYVLNTSFANDFFWCDMFVAWAIKSLLVRYGGASALRAALPFFLGLILGDFVTGSVWSIIGAVFHFDLFRTFAS